jgi:hypothetical protein
MMRPEEHIEQAKRLCQRLERASATVGPPERRRTVSSADPNELKKLLTFLIRRRNLEELKTLVSKLPDSNFAKRSGSTPAYHRNIRSALASDFYSLSVDDAIQVLGWACRLLKPQRGRP